jgi:DNA-directed RNA polymerase subunit M/transcription elongation factor TFIIS
MAKIQIVELDGACPNCGSKIVLKTKKGFLSSKTWLECPECGKTWNDEKEYNKDVKLAKELEELEMIEKSGELPVLHLVGSSLVLKKNEQLHLHESSVALLEERTRTYTYRSKSMGFRIKVAKGVYLTPRVGGGSIKQTETKIERLDAGELYLTSKRLAFIGEKKTINIPLKKIFAVEPFADAIKIGREGKQKAEYFTVENPLKWATLIRIAVEKLE